MVVGLGTDLVSVPRVRSLLARHGERFVARVFTDDEVRYSRATARPEESYAARFAAKEACFKAVGQGWPEEGIRYHDVEVVRGASGPPVLRLSGRVAELARAKGALHTLVSLSHTGELAMAVVLLESGSGEARPWIG